MRRAANTGTPLWLVFVVLAVFLATGCRPSYRDEAYKRMDKNWTEDQKLAAYQYSFRYFLEEAKGASGARSFDEVSDNTDPSKFAIPEIRYGRIKKKAMVDRIENFLGDFDYILSYKNEEEAKYVEMFGFRAALEREEQVVKAIRARLKASELSDRFRDLTGAVSASPHGMGRGGWGGGRTPGVGDGRDRALEKKMENPGGYDAKDVFGPKDPMKAFEFKVDQIDEARKNKILQPVDTGKISLARRFGQKASDPSDPNDRNKFVWLPIAMDFELTSYKILEADRPEDNTPNYTEGYRLTGGKREKFPCLKIFTIATGYRGQTTTIVLDKDKEGEPGFGLPDYVDRYDGDASVDSILKNEQLLKGLFDDKSKLKRIPPKPKELYAEISPADKPIDVWETAADPKVGWTIPFRYASEIPMNYNIKLVLGEPAGATPTTGPADPFKMPLRELKWIKKEFTNGNRYEASIGQVVEYYRPKAPFDKPNVVSARVLSYEDTKKFTISFIDGPDETQTIRPGINRYIEDRPSAIAFTYGDKRWVVKRSEGSAVFDKKKEISRDVLEDTGWYQSEWGGGWGGGWGSPWPPIGF